MSTGQQAKDQAAGLGVDASGGPVVDPTANVLSLVEAAVTRLDDLRAAETRRQDDLRTESEKHNREIIRITMDFQEKLREAEAKRIDAIRVVDVNAVSVANVRATDQAAILASQVQTSAEALRSLVATSANTLANAQSAVTSEITKRLSELERAKYEGAGRSTVADPMLEKLVARMESLAESRAVAGGKSEGMGATAKLIVGIVSFFGLLLGMIGTTIGIAGALWALLR